MVVSGQERMGLTAQDKVYWHRAVRSLGRVIVKVAQPRPRSTTDPSSRPAAILRPQIHDPAKRYVPVRHGLKGEATGIARAKQRASSWNF